MKKTLIFSFVLGIINLVGCSSTSTTPATPACTSNSSCSDGTPVCNTTSGKCVAESATACATNTFCASIAPGNTCSATATTSGTCVCGTSAACTAGQQCIITAPATTLACATWPRYAFLTSKPYTLGTAYTGSNTSIASLGDAAKVCNDEYKANGGAIATANPNKKFIPVMATTGNSLWDNTYPFAKNPRPIFDLKPNVQISGPLPTTAAPSAKCVAGVCLTTTANTTVGFDCFGDGLKSCFYATTISGSVAQFFWTGVPTPFSATPNNDISGFFTKGSAASTCSSTASSTVAATSWASGAPSSSAGATNDSFASWSNGTSTNCASNANLILCLEQD